MTKDQLDAIRARVDMATPGEWRIEYGDRGWTVWVKTTATGSMCIARVGYANFDGRNANFIANAPTDLRALLAEVERFRDAHAMAVQISGELCEKCGWAMRFPGEKCRCELLAEVERLTAERDTFKKEAERFAKAIHTRGCQQQSAYNATCVCGADEHQRDLRTLAFRRGVAAMREAAASHFSVVAPYDYISPRIRALPDPEDKP